MARDASVVNSFFRVVCCCGERHISIAEGERRDINGAKLTVSIHVDTHCVNVGSSITFEVSYVYPFGTLSMREAYFNALRVSHLLTSYSVRTILAIECRDNP